MCLQYQPIHILETAYRLMGHNLAVLQRMELYTLHNGTVDGAH
jgi:hypothetical protein